MSGRVLDDMDRKETGMLERIGSLYGLGELEMIRRLDAGNFNDSFLVSSSDGIRCVVRTSHDIVPQLEESLRIQDTLYRQGCSVARPRSSINDRYSESLDDSDGRRITVSVLDYRDGVTHAIIEKDSISVDTFHLMGQHLARLHQGLSGIDVDDVSFDKWFDSDNCFNCFDREHEKLEKDSCLLNMYLECHERCKNKYSADQIIHSDIHFDNILICGSDVCFCDFDDMCLGDDRMDVALLLFDLAVVNDPPRDWNAINRYATSIIDGYNEASGERTLAISELYDWFELLDLSFRIVFRECELDGLEEGWVKRYLLDRNDRIVKNQPFWRA